MMENYDKEYWNDKKCPPINCRKKQCECGLEKVFLSAALGDDSEDSPIAPKNGEYCNAIVVYEANGHIYIYSKEGIPTLVETEGSSIEDIIEQLEEALAQEILDRQAADNVLQGEIDDLKNSPDVVDIVATYAALQAYDTSKLGDNDIVRVLADEQHDGASTYYRWNKQSSTWTYIGEVGDYYTKGQVDTLLADKQDELTAGANITIEDESGDLVISATDTTYSNFTGTNGNTDGSAGLVPAPLTTDAGKFLKADGTWDVIIGDTVYSDKNTSSGNTGGAVYIGNLDTNQDEQPDPTVTDAHKRYFWALPANNSRIPTGNSINILGNTDGTNSGVNNNFTIMLGTDATTYAQRGIAIGYSAKADDSSIGIGYSAGGGNWSGKIGMIAIGANTIANNSNYAIHIGGNTGNSYGVRGGNADNSIAIGKHSRVNNLTNSVALGAYAEATRQGEVNVGLVTGETTGGYNSTAYRVIGGVHDPVDAHDAATKGYVDGKVLTGAGVPTTSTVGTVGQIYEDTTNGDLYICTDATNPYVWEEVGAGGSGPTVVQTTGTSTTDVMSQNAVTSMVFADPSTQKRIKIGSGTSANIGNESIEIGGNSTATNTASVALGSNSNANNAYSVAIGSGSSVSGEHAVAVGYVSNVNGDKAVGLGRGANAAQQFSVALGAGAVTTAQGEINVSTGNTYTTKGYNNSNYRLISGVYDGQGAHDAVTVSQVNATIDAINTALSTNIPHIGA